MVEVQYEFRWCNDWNPFLSFIFHNDWLQIIEDSPSRVCHLIVWLLSVFCCQFVVNLVYY